MRRTISSCAGKKHFAMTATCREACCNVTPRRTVSELFDSGFRRNREAPLPITGATCTGAEDNTVAFSLDVADGKIAAIGFQASCCATLIAYCEFIAEIAPGFRLTIAQGLTAANVVASVPGRPQARPCRAGDRRIPRRAGGCRRIATGSVAGARPSAFLVIRTAALDSRMT